MNAPSLLFGLALWPGWGSAQAGKGGHTCCNSISLSVATQIREGRAATKTAERYDSMLLCLYPLVEQDTSSQPHVSDEDSWEHGTTGHLWSNILLQPRSITTLQLGSSSAFSKGTSSSFQEATVFIKGVAWFQQHAPCVSTLRVPGSPRTELIPGLRSELALPYCSFSTGDSSLHHPLEISKEQEKVQQFGIFTQLRKAHAWQKVSWKRLVLLLGWCSWDPVEGKRKATSCMCKSYSGGPRCPKGLIQPLFSPHSFMALTAFIVKWVQVWAMLCWSQSLLQRKLWICLT